MNRIKYLPVKLFTLIMGLVACFSISRSQAQALTALQSKFNSAAKGSVQEKIYVHINKTFFVTGEITWFKIYAVDGATNKLLDLSKVAYVELLDQKNNAVLQAKIALNQGTGNGSFYIPLTLTNGNYRLRAYTNWMKNFDADYYFEKQIRVINPLKTPPSQAEQALTYDVQFFPEGGHLVKGIEGKMAFKVTASDGSGHTCSGVVVNQQNDTVARFKSLKFGIGCFTFTPLAQSGYRAIIKAGDKIIVKDLPEVNTSGYVMQTVTNDEGWNVTVKGLGVEAGDVYLIAHSRSQIKIAERASLVNGSVHFSIDKNKLDDGISYITLFDEQQRPLCERLVFKRPVKKLLIDANTGDQLFGTRKKVSLDISVRNQDNKISAANLSVSVFRADSLQQDDDAHIAAWLWLRAGVKGYIESPDYYFNQNSQETNQALDNLLLSQGWTQFDWAKTLIDSQPGFTFLPEYSGPIINARITDVHTNSPAKNITAYLTISGKNNKLYLAKSDSTGKLLFNTRDFYGAKELVLQTNYQQDSTYHIDITSSFSEQYGNDAIPAFSLNPAVKNTLTDNSLNMQVQNTFSASQLAQFIEPTADSSLFYGRPSNTYKLDDYTRFTTMEEVIHEYVRFIEISRNNGKRGFEVLNVDKMLPGQPLILLDGRPIFDADKTFAIDPLKVKRLDVVTTNYIYGHLLFNGILSFTTYNGVSNNMEMDPRAVILDYEGLQLQRKFYMPLYESEQQINSPVPDFRSALYWNPDVNTGPSGQNKLTFYTGDKPGRYIGIIEGLAADGEAGTTTISFMVKK